MCEEGGKGSFEIGIFAIVTVLLRALAEALIPKHLMAMSQYYVRGTNIM